jgi:hypothetical protein
MKAHRIITTIALAFLKGKREEIVYSKTGKVVGPENKSGKKD